MYFKYRHWNDNTKKILTTNSLYYSDATSFNDLYECVVAPEAGSKIRGHKNMITAARKNYRILCLSKAKNHPLMWAHYSDSCKGVCLEFDFVEDDPLYNIPKLVNYEDIPPVVTDASLNSGADISREMFFYKHTSWSYEQEYRIFQPKENATVPFKPASLKAIYIAPAAVSSPIFDEVIASVADYNRAHGTGVNVIRLKRKEHSYVIEEDIIA